MSIAIGDIHGCLDPLRLLVERLPTAETLIFLGDYIDRGPHPAGVVRYLRKLAGERPCRFIKGNHEDMMRKAIADPEQDFNWFFNGGAATIKSYGVERARWKKTGERSTLVGEDQEFFSGLEPYVEEEDCIYVHAGVDVSIPRMADQRPEVLLWVRDSFFRNADRWKGKKIVFAHTPTTSMSLPSSSLFRDGSLTGIDTGCVYGGYLTALDTRTGKVYQEPSSFSTRD